MEVDLEELASIIELLDKTEFTQFRFEKGDLRISVSRGTALIDEPRGEPLSTAATVTAAPPVPQGTARAASDPPSTAPSATSFPATGAATPRVPSTSTVSTGSAPPAHAVPALPHVTETDTLVRAPMLGTFYRSPKPGDPPFVDLGSVVEADTVLCILEVMKLMNSVTAGTRGVITQVLIRDGELVDFDQPLFVISQA